MRSRLISEKLKKSQQMTLSSLISVTQQAETISKWCTKGSGIHIEGRLRLDQWDDKNTGEKRSKLGIVLENFTFVGGRANATPGQDYEESAPAPRRAAPSAPRPSAPPPSDMDDADVPF